MEPCNQEGRLSTLEHQSESLAKTLEKFELKLDMILNQINKVAVLETSHQHHDQAIGRVFVKLAEVELEAATHFKEIDKTLHAVEEFINTTRGMAKMANILWAVLGSSVLGIIIKMAFFANGHVQ